MASGTINYGIQYSTVDDMNIPLDRPNGIYINTYAYSASNKVNSILPNDGLLITYNTNQNTKQQIALDLNGSIGRRYYYNGTLSEWKGLIPS